MGSKWTLASLKVVYGKSLCLSKGELTQARGFIPMEIWDSVLVKNFIVPVLHLQIGIGNDVLSKLLDLLDSDVEKLSTGEEVTRNT